MPAERCRVGAVVNGLNQYYQRDREELRDGRYVAVPYFVVDPSQAATMSEAAAKAFVTRLRERRENAWVEDCKDGRRINMAHEPQQQSQFGDTRTPVAATLDDENTPEARWYVVRPTNTPHGPKWFLRIDLPGIAEPQIIYESSPLGVLQRAADLDYLKYAPLYERPVPQQPVQNNSSVGYRRRPGSIQ